MKKTRLGLTVLVVAFGSFCLGMDDASCGHPLPDKSKEERGVAVVPCVSARPTKFVRLSSHATVSFKRGELAVLPEAESSESESESSGIFIIPRPIDLFCPKGHPAARRIGILFDSLNRGMQEVKKLRYILDEIPEPFFFKVFENYQSGNLLHLAAPKCSVAVVKSLVEWMDIFISQSETDIRFLLSENSHGTPYAIAKRNGNDPVADYLHNEEMRRLPFLMSRKLEGLNEHDRLCKAVLFNSAVKKVVLSRSGCPQSAAESRSTSSCSGCETSSTSASLASFASMFISK